MDDVSVGKTISYALRHNPSKYHLELDAEGFVRVEELFKGLKEVDGLDVCLEDLERIMANSDKKRYEVRDGFVRAMYGHSKVHVVKEAVMPPDVLYHGTTNDAYLKICESGIQPMERQFVHLSQDVKTACVVGKRRCKDPVILRIDAKRAFEDGVLFYHGNDTTWLCASVDVRYISVEK